MAGTRRYLKSFRLLQNFLRVKFLIYHYGQQEQDFSNLIEKFRPVSIKLFETGEVCVSDGHFLRIVS